ncbi:hypothetical protein GGQ80_003233 [Sphingomonas jinjuensis]|uniref:Uncharacterized protein n=1 Tax=Sphingomonas jinjuensis TaxID=535907 RepID=A0A840F7T9_9SPHN|nr:hypothetical protein [Sphingomonas jinjuensis]MBB4155313.1 hypothetical protein [Sphingomonas jinjuensis]
MNIEDYQLATDEDFAAMEEAGETLATRWRDVVTATSIALGWAETRTAGLVAAMGIGPDSGELASLSLCAILPGAFVDGIKGHVEQSRREADIAYAESVAWAASVIENGDADPIDRTVAVACFRFSVTRDVAERALRNFSLLSGALLSIHEERDAAASGAGLFIHPAPLTVH